MDCQFGDHYFQSREKKSKRLCTKSTRKIGCKAHILIKEYCLYPEYQINSADIKVNELCMLKKAKHQEIIQTFHEGVPIQKENRFYVSLPTNAAHNGVHLTGKAAGMTQRVDPMVSKFIEEIVREGTTDVDTIQKLLKSRVSLELKDFPSDVLDRAFNPSKDDIRNHIHQAIRAIELSKFDQ